MDMTQNTEERAFAMVSVEWLMKNITTSIDGVNLSDGFARLLSYKLNWHIDEIYGPNCLDGYYDDLCDSIMAEGFTTPICVFLDRDYYGNVHFSQGNGHHRLALAILLCLESIPVCFSFDGDYMHSDVTGE